MTPHELREKTVALCRQDPVFFTKNFVHIEDKDAAELVQPFRLWPMQEDALRQLHPQLHTFAGWLAGPGRPAFERALTSGARWAFDR